MQKKRIKTQIYKKLIIALVIFAVIFLLATSGRFILNKNFTNIKDWCTFFNKIYWSII